MQNLTVQNRNSSSVLPKFAAALGVLLFASAAAHAQDYSAFTGANGLNAPGITTPDGSTITFPLVRQDQTMLTIKVPGIAAQPAAPEAVANGYIGIRKNLNFSNTYFVVGAFPALASELPTLESALELIGLPITAVANETAGTNKAIFTVHVEGTITEPATILAGGIATALATIASPQANVSIQYPGVVYPTVPPRFKKVVNETTAELIDFNAEVFSIPRNDATPITLGSIVADPSVGVGQIVTISGNGTSLLTAELALKPNEVQPVLAILIGGGFTVSSAGDYFTNDSTHLTFVHAVAVATTQDGFYAQAEQLGFAILKTVKK